MLSKSYEKLQNLSDNTSQVIISVKDPQIDVAGGFTTYLIMGMDKMGTYQIRRRFNDFFLLRQSLVKQWPGCYIPPIPSKKMTGNKQDKFIEVRRRFLEYFCRKISGLRYLYFCEPFQLFIRNKAFALETLSESHYQVSAHTIAETYKALFSQYQSKESQHDLKTKTNSFYGYLGKSEKELRELRELIRELAGAQQNFNDNLLVTTSIMLPEYQKHGFSQYLQPNSQMVFLNDSDTCQKVRFFRDAIGVNPFDYLLDLIYFQLKQVQAMKQAIQTRQFYEQSRRKIQQKRKDNQTQLSKLMSGKTTFKSIFSRGSKNQQIGILQKSIVDSQRQIQGISVIVDFISVLLVREIDNYKAYKLVQYQQALHEVARIELQQLNIYSDLVKAVMVATNNIRFE